jgi:hypothetical protein
MLRHVACLILKMVTESCHVAYLFARPKQPQAVDGSLLCCGVWKQEMSATKGEKWRKGSVKNCTILSLCPVQRGMTFPQTYWPPKMWQHKVILWKGKWLTIAFCGLWRPLFWWAGTNLSKERNLFFKDRNLVIFQRWRLRIFFFEMKFWILWDVLDPTLEALMSFETSVLPVHEA